MGVNLVQTSDPTKLVAAVTLENLPGGVSVGGITDYATSWQAAKHLDDGPDVTQEMYYEAEYIATLGEQRTRIYLYNTPLTCRQDGNFRGLANSKRARLYQTEYVPSPVDAGPAFTTDLSTIGSGTKNTARWTINLDPSVLTSSMFVLGHGTT